MANNDDVLIVGSLKDEELRKSIDNLVDYVGDKTNEMAMKFNDGLDKMKLAMKDFAVTQKVSVDLMKQAWREMSSSFDAMVAAQSGATGGGHGSGKPSFPDDTVGALKQEIAALQKERDEMKLNSDELSKQNTLLDERQRKLKEQTTSMASLRLDRTLNMSSNDLESAEKKLRALEILQRRYKDTTELSAQQQKRLADAIARTKREVDRLTSNKPKTLKDVIGMDESSLEAIAAKMRALKRVQIDPNNAAQVKRLGDEYARLQREQAKLMGKNIQLTHSNNYLAQSFGYIRNRIVYALTLGAVTSFTKQIYEIRGQYELLERSLGILINDMRKGSEVFNELNQMALKSPFTLMELATGAKQLLAYNFAEEEVVDTTRRLADISAALGVPMERLVYNLGQIKAQTALTARDARDFANAGLAIVPMLAQMYTEEKRFGDEMVTTAQVFDMMSKKMVSYSDVIKVINKVTDEGGKFFDFQAKQADTLKVKMANLTLAWNNMLNEIGQENQTLLELPLRSLKLLFENWRSLSLIIREVVLAFGAYKAAAMLVALWNKRMAILNTVNAFMRLVRMVYAARGAMAAFNVVCKANPIGLVVSALAAAVGYFYLFNDAVEDAGNYTERFGKAGAKVINETEALFDTLKGISKESSNYKVVMGELNNILGEYGLELVKETDGLDVLNEKRRIAISLIKEESLERKHLNDVQQGRDEYSSAVSEAKEKMKEALKSAQTFSFAPFVESNEEIQKNANAIANIISDVVEQNITLIAGKTGDEYQKGVDEIFAIIQQRMRDIGISEETISKEWLDNTLFSHNNIVRDFVETVRAAKEEQDRYIESTDKAYEAEKKAIESGADFNDRVNQTQTQLMKAANDTDNFYKKIDKLVKDYSGQNIIDFLVKVKTDVPAWMSQKSLTELTQLAARFTAMATNAQKAGMSTVNANGKILTVEELFTRAAQYSQAAQNKAVENEARKSTTLTREASEALKEYKSALEAVNVAKNRHKQGTADQSLVTEKEAEAQKAYNKALAKGVSLEDLRKAKEGKTTKKDPFGDALTKEVQLITDMQKLYKEYQKAGVDADTARIASAKEYEKTLQSVNAKLAKFGIKGISGERLATMDAHALKDYYTQLRNIADAKGNTKGVEALEKAIRSLNIEITKLDYKKITDGLNNELGKLKDEYELAVELDANPELGDMFADMFGIDTSTLPKTFGEAYDRANKIAKEKLNELKVNTKDFDLMSTVIKGDKDNKWLGLEITSQPVQDFIKNQKTWQDMLKKNMLDTEKMLDDYIKKYGDYSDKIAEIEAGRLEKLKKLNEAYYTEEMRKRPEYIAKLNAIEQGASKEKQQVDFDDFKNSRYYTMMFENLDYISTKTIRDMRDRVRELIDTMNDLTPEQLKTLMSQYEKLEQKLVKRSPFKTLTKDLKEYFSTSKERNAANQEFKNAQKEYDAQKKNVAALKEKYEQAKANSYTSQSYLDSLQIEIGAENEILQILKQQLDAAQKKADKYNLTAKLAKSEALAVANVVGQNLQSLGDLRDFLQKDLGIELSDELNGLVDGLSKVGQGINKITSSATSGDVVGVITGVGQTIYGLYDGIASIFGGGSASDKKITKQIQDSERAVKELELAYIDLEHAIDKAYGTASIGAKKAAIANKELQLVELKRQLSLEQSRKSKDRDDDRIIELQKQIKELQYDIKEATDEIINDLLGISSVGDAMENMMDNFIEALRNGEDAMKVFDESVNDMIANMVKKMYVTKILQPWFENAWKTVQSDVEQRSKSLIDWVNYVMESFGTTDAKEALTKLFKDGSLMQVDPKTWVDMQRKLGTMSEEILSQIDTSSIDAFINSLAAIYESGGLTLDDIKRYADVLRDGRESLGVEMDSLEDYLKELGLINASKQLSALQQGIQGITEDTAGAIEAYMNIVSQRIFEQNDYLMQIRDIMVGFDLDVQVATIGQILLQLQQSYQVQQAIQARLDGWSNANGMAVRVEMV